MEKLKQFSTEIISREKIHPAKYNPRKISDDSLEGLGNSIDEFGLVEPLVWNKQTGNLVAGHQRLKKLDAAGIKEVTCIVVDLPIVKEKALNIALNNEKIQGEWDHRKLILQLEELSEKEQKLFEELKFDELKFEELEKFQIKPEKKYTKKVDAPIYEPTGEKPTIKELFNNEKEQKLIKEIEEAKINKKDKEFLKICAKRHIVFDYSKIAEYYCHASKEVQRLMEKSALIIIDFKKAIEEGYVILSKEMEKQYLEDYSD